MPTYNVRDVENQPITDKQTVRTCRNHDIKFIKKCYDSRYIA